MKSGVAILISDKVNFRSKIVSKEGHYIFINISINQEDMITNTDTLNNRAPKHMEQKLMDLNGDIDIL